MPDRSTAPLARCIRAAVLDVASPAADGDLLGAFVRHRDPAAFEALVRRHGPLVAATCRSILPNPADADDASQATFVVLYRKAQTIRGGRALAGWLHRVARRAALEVKKAATRRRGYEGKASRAESLPAVDLSLREACALLHEELDALPPRYRLPLIACYLEGKTQSGAARALGWSAEVVRGRLDRGREKLRQRLRRRGVTLSAALLAGAAVPPTVAAINLPTVLVPSPLVAGVVRSMTSSAVRVWSGVGGLALTAGLVVGTVVFGAGGKDSPRPSEPPAKEPAAERPAPRVDAFGDPLPEGAVARLGTVRFNHGDRLRILLYSPDGKRVVSVGNGQARVWDADNGAHLLQFSTGSTDWDEQATLSPDGKKLVLLIQSWNSDPVREFDIDTGKELRTTGLPVKRNEMSVDRRNAISPDGRLAALHTPDTVNVFDIETGKQLHRLPKNGREVKSVAFAGPDLLVTADAAKAIEIWEARTGKRVESFDHGDAVGVITASPDGKLLATLTHHVSSVDRFAEKDVVRVWDLSTRKKVQEFSPRPGNWVMRIAFSPDGKKLAAYSLAKGITDVTVWDCESGKQVGQFPGAVGQVAAMSPDSRRLAAGANLGKFDVWDLETGQAVVAASKVSPWVGAVYLSRAGDLVTSLGKTSFTTWDVGTGRPQTSTEIPAHLFERSWCRFSRDGRYAITVQHLEKKGNVVVWDVPAAKPIHMIPIAMDPHGVTAAFSADSTRVAVRIPEKEPLVSIRELPSGKEGASFRLPKVDWPGYLFFAPDGESMIVTGKRTIAYNLADGKELFGWTMAPQPTGSKGQMGIAGPGGVIQTEDERLAWRTLVVSPGGTVAACVLSAGWSPDAKLADRIALCDVRTGKILRRWGDTGRQSRGFEVLAFSADGRLLASTDNYNVHVWEVATGKEVRVFRGHQNEIENLAFSGNGRRLASSSHDSTVLVWDLSAASAAEGDPAAWWANLSNADSAKAYESVWRLVDAADDVTVPLLRKHLRPATPADLQRIRKAVAELDSDEFRVRDRAFKELSDLGQIAGAALREALAKTSSAEARNRIEQLLAKMVGPPSSGELLRTMRALAVLESKGTPAAKDFLRELADGAPGAWLTQEAKAALQRVTGDQ